MYLTQQQAGGSIKYEYFRQKQPMQDTARKVCNWVNTNINVTRIIGITTVLCHYDNKNMINLFYNETKMPQDVLQQTSSLVLAYEIFRQERTMMSSWRLHNQKMLPKINELAKRVEIVAINSLQYDQAHELNLTVVWYKRQK